MIILHITDILKAECNGVAAAVSNYLEYESKNNNVAVYNLNDAVLCDKVKSFSYDKYKSINDLPQPFNNPDFVIFNEIYKIKYIKLYKECKKNNIKYIIIPHGCLTKKAQNKKIIKKKLANFILFNKFIKEARAIQFLNEHEKKCSKLYNKKNIISGNGIEYNNKKNEYKLKNYIFIGRYDINTKGLDLLLNVVKNNIQWFKKNNVYIQLFGRTTGNGYAWLNHFINENKLSSIVELNGPIYTKEKEKMLLSAYGFVQVSRHEGQPIGILEALSYGVPCIVTYGTSFGNYVNKKHCGIGIEFDEEKLMQAFIKMNNKNFRNECSTNCSIINEEYNWDTVIKDCIKKYEELL